MRIEFFGQRNVDQPQELDDLSNSLRIAFVSNQSQWWRKQRLVAKYLKMKLEGVIYPDVYCLALMLADKFDFLLEDEKVPAGKYDLIIAELGASETQLRYLESLVMASDPPVAVIPGPPAILSREFTDAKLRSALRILRGARHVWAYSPELKTFCDGLIGQPKAAVIPWPYDYAATQKLGLESHRESNRHKILVQAPMSFHDIVQNHPFVLKGVLLDIWQELPVRSARQDFVSYFHLQLHRHRKIQVVRICCGIAVCPGSEAWVPVFCTLSRRVRWRHQSDFRQHSWTDYFSCSSARTSRNF